LLPITALNMLPIIEGDSFWFCFPLLKPLCTKIQATFAYSIYSSAGGGGNAEAE
jgi:hypothetical protein